MLRNGTLDLLKYSSFPALAAALDSRIEAIMSRWNEVLRQKLPSADQLTAEQLRDELPVVLRELAKTLEASDGSHFAQLEQASDGHGQTRFHQSYSVEELLYEYALLRPLVLDETATTLGRNLSPEEAAAINMGLDTAVRKGVIRFTVYQQQQLKTVAEAQSKYLSFLSHDLRGGLNGVLLMVEVLKRELAGEEKFSESIQDLDSMRRSILDTVGTMDRFLHAEQFRQGKVQPHNTTVALPGFLQDLIATSGYPAKAKGLEIIGDFDRQAVAFTDKDLLMLIMQNLLSNAIKYTARGAIRISLSKEDNKVTISVADDGPGIPADRMQALFDPYVRGETHGQDGVGLGLSIAKQAAELIGGRLSVESTPGKGATFKLELTQS